MNGVKDKRIRKTKTSAPADESTKGVFSWLFAASSLLYVSYFALSFLVRFSYPKIEN